MNRIILGMAVTNYLLVAVTGYLGFLSEPGADAQKLAQDALSYHLGLGLITTLYTMLVHCMVFTYFLGTGRWVKETAAAYSLAAHFTGTSNRCRVRALALAFSSVLLVVVAVASGANAHTKAWPAGALNGHRIATLVAYTYMLFAYRLQISAIERHIGLTNEVMAEVNRIRRTRGQAELG